MKYQNKQQIQKLLNVYRRFQNAYEGTAKPLVPSQYKLLLFQKRGSIQQPLQYASTQINPILFNSYTGRRKRLYSASNSTRKPQSQSLTQNQSDISNLFQLDQFLRKLYRAKSKDIKIQTSAKQQYIFLERMRKSITHTKLICTQNGFGFYSIQVISNYIKASDNLQILILDKNCLGDEAMKTLAKILPESKLIKLSLVSTNISQKGCKYLIQSLQHTNHLTNLNLSSSQGLYRNKLGPEGIKPFQNILKKVCTLNSLDVSGSNITQQGYSFICEGIECTPYLYSLNFAKNEIKQFSFIKFANKFSYCHLVRLNLSKNEIKDDGIIFLGEILGRDYRRNSISEKLKYLNLKDNVITSVGLQYFCKLMNTNFTLEQLILDNNPFDKGGRFQCIKTFLKLNRSIHKLSLRKVNITDFSDLSQGMNFNLSITDLNISENYLQKSSFRQICFFLKTNKILKTIHLNQCSIIDQYVKNLTESINFSKNIQQIHLQRNFIKDSGAQLIQKLLIKNKHITTIKLQKNLISLKNLDDIQKCLKNNKFESIYVDPNLEAYHIKYNENKRRKLELLNQITKLRQNLQNQKVKNLQDDIICIDAMILQKKKEIQKSKLFLENPYNNNNNSQFQQSFITQHKHNNNNKH